MKSASLNSRRPKNLPAPVSTFIGREGEISKIKQLIIENRLVTLTGAGGTGKTRLSVQVAQDLWGVFNDNIWFIELASLTDENLVPHKIMSTLGVREQPGRSLSDVIVYYLSLRPALIILDNCEHLITECAYISEILLQKCPDLHIIATSREVLGITGEVTWMVPPLSLPDRQPWVDITSSQGAAKEYEKSESFQLFVARAISKSPNFRITINNGAWVAEICRRLDGLPLAIELAAGQVRILSVQEIARRLDNRFHLLTTGSRTAHPRQQTLVSTLDWSYDLLSTKERKVFQRLSTFAGGATLKAAEVVCSGGNVDTGDVLEKLSQLVDKSLVLTDTFESGETRYHMLETIREYAHEKLAQSVEWGTVRNQHLEFYLQLAKEAESKLRGPEEIFWYERLEDEIDNIRIALTWAMKSNNSDAGLQVASSLGLFWFVRGHSKEGIGWLEKALEHRQSAQAASIAQALKYLGGLLITIEGRDLYQTVQILEESIELYQDLEDKSGIAWVLNLLGIIAISKGEDREAIKFLNQSLELRRKIGDPWSIAHTMQNFATLYLQQGDYERAKAYSQETIAWFQRAGYQRGVARTLLDLAQIAQHEGNFTYAKNLMTKSLTQLLPFGDKWSAAVVLENIATLEHEEGFSSRAVQLYGTAEALREAVGMPLMEVECKDYETVVEALRRDISETEFSRAWAQGRAMTLEQVVELVINESEESQTKDKDIDELGGLTARELETAILISEGKSNREIAEAMTVSVKTIETYVTRILRKLGFVSRVQVATWVIDNDIS